MKIITTIFEGKRYYIAEKFSVYSIVDEIEEARNFQWIGLFVNPKLVLEGVQKSFPKYKWSYMKI